MIKLVWLAVPVLLSGCATGFTASLGGPPSSPIVQGTVIELNQAVSIRPGSTRVWFQSGRPAPGYDWYEPACSLEVRTLDAKAEQTIEPGAFTVRRVQPMRDQADLNTPRPQLAAVGVFVGLGSGFGNDGYVRIWKGYHFWLESMEQPDVLRLTCQGAYAEEWEARAPNLADIQEAFGDWASVRQP